MSTEETKSGPRRAALAKCGGLIARESAATTEGLCCPSRSPGTTLDRSAVPSHAPASLPFTASLAFASVLAGVARRGPLPQHVELRSEGPREAKALADFVMAAIVPSKDPGRVGFGSTP